MQMARSVRRFLEALLRRTSFWVGSVLFIFPTVAQFVPRTIMSDTVKVGSLENDIWLSFAGAFLLLWAAFREWDELRELAVKLLREAWASPGGDGQPESPSLSPDALRDEIAKLRLQLTQQEGRQLTSEQRAALVAALLMPR